MQIHELIKAYRKKKGLSQESLAAALQMTKSAVSNYETGLRLPDFQTIKSLKKILDIPATVLLEEKDMHHEPFFTEGDFIRFCSFWEWNDGCDLSKQDLTAIGDKLRYTIYDKNPYYFELSEGHITWQRVDVDADFIEEFHALLSALAHKKMYSRPALFEVEYENLSDEGDRKTYVHYLQGYEDDAEEDIFVLASAVAVLNNESSLQVDGSDFTYYTYRQ